MSRVVVHIKTGDWPPDSEGAWPLDCNSDEMSARSKYFERLFAAKSENVFVRDYWEDDAGVHTQINFPVANWVEARACASILFKEPVICDGGKNWKLQLAFADYLEMDRERHLIVDAVATNHETTDPARYPADELLGMAQSDDPVAHRLLTALGLRAPDAARRDREGMLGVIATVKANLDQLSPAAVARLYRWWSRRMLDYGMDEDAYFDVFEERELLAKLREGHPKARVALDRETFEAQLIAITGHTWIDRVGDAYWPSDTVFAGGAIASAACRIPDANDLDAWVVGKTCMRDSIPRGFGTGPVSRVFARDRIHYEFDIKRFDRSRMLVGPIGRLIHGIESHSRVLCKRAKTSLREYSGETDSIMCTIAFYKKRATPLQIIEKRGSTPAKVAGGFDLDCVRAWYDPRDKKLHAHFGALESWYSRSTGWRPRYGDQPLDGRLVKYRARGFAIEGFSDALLARLARLTSVWGSHHAHVSREISMILDDPESVARAAERFARADLENGIERDGELGGSWHRTSPLYPSLLIYVDGARLRRMERIYDDGHSTRRTCLHLNAASRDALNVYYTRIRNILRDRLGTSHDDSTVKDFEGDEPVLEIDKVGGFSRDHRQTLDLDEPVYGYVRINEIFVYDDRLKFALVNTLFIEEKRDGALVNTLFLEEQRDEAEKRKRE